MVRHSARNRRGWQRSEARVVSAPEKGSQPSAEEERGTERLPDGRRIPYSRQSYRGDNVVTTYGNHDAADHAKGISLLVKHERRGKPSWGVVLNAVNMRRGEASSALQDAWGTNEANNLYFAVEAVRLAFELGFISKVRFISKVLS
jgi:hypothetical protein